jgi:hypothetical protein
MVASSVETRYIDEIRSKQRHSGGDLKRFGGPAVLDGQSITGETLSTSCLDDVVQT